MNPTNFVIVFVPGFKGTTLLDQTNGKRVWLTASQALWGRQSLAIASDDLAITNPLKLIAGPILDQVPVLPDLWTNDVYGGALRALQAAMPSHAKLVVFSYDWRQRPETIASDLAARLAALIASGIDDIRIIAHSMGAMVTAWTLREHMPAAITRIAFIAGAFRGSAKIFRTLQVGDPVLRNKTLLSAQALGSFASSYYFLPTAWPYVVNEHGQAFARDLCDSQLWQQQGWGLMHSAPPKVSAARQRFLTELFETSRHFLRVLDSPWSGTLRTKVLNIVGTARKTLNRVIALPNGQLILNAKQRNSLPQLKNISMGAPGDGTIAVHSSQLPAWLEPAAVQPTLTFNAEHMQIVQPGPALNAAIRFSLADG